MLPSRERENIFHLKRSSEKSSTQKCLFDGVRDRCQEGRWCFANITCFSFLKLEKMKSSQTFISFAGILLMLYIDPYSELTELDIKTDMINRTEKCCITFCYISMMSMHPFRYMIDVSCDIFNVTFDIYGEGVWAPKTTCRRDWSIIDFYIYIYYTIYLMM